MFQICFFEHGDPTLLFYCGFEYPYEKIVAMRQNAAAQMDSDLQFSEKLYPVFISRQENNPACGGEKKKTSQQKQHFAKNTKQKVKKKQNSKKVAKKAKLRPRRVPLVSVTKI